MNPSVKCRKLNSVHHFEKLLKMVNAIYFQTFLLMGSPSFQLDFSWWKHISVKAKFVQNLRFLSDFESWIFEKSWISWLCSDFCQILKSWILSQIFIRFFKSWISNAVKTSTFYNSEPDLSNLKFSQRFKSSSF